MEFKVKYSIKEVHKYFEKEIDELKVHLKNRVENKKMSAKDARKKLDMYLNALFFLDVCLSWQEREDFLNDKTFSQAVLKELEEQKSQGKNLLRKAMKSL